MLQTQLEKFVVLSYCRNKNVQYPLSDPLELCEYYFDFSYLSSSISMEDMQTHIIERGLRKYEHKMYSESHRILYDHFLSPKL